MRRRPEAYHEAIRFLDEGDDAAAPATGDGSIPASIHDVVRIREKGLATHLVYDAYERRSGLIRVLATRRDPGGLGDGPGDRARGCRGRRLRRSSDLATGRLVTRRDATIAGATIRVVKTLTLGGDRRAPT